MNLKKEYAEPHIKDVLLTQFQHFVYLIGIAASLIFPMMKDNPNFVYSALPEQWRTWWLVSILFVYETYDVIRFVTTFLLVSSFTYAQIYSVHFWLNQARYIFST